MIPSWLSHRSLRKGGRTQSTPSSFLPTKRPPCTMSTGTEESRPRKEYSPSLSISQTLTGCRRHPAHPPARRSRAGQVARIRRRQELLSRHAPTSSYLRQSLSNGCVLLFRIVHARETERRWSAAYSSRRGGRAHGESSRLRTGFRCLLYRLRIAPNSHLKMREVWLAIAFSTNYYAV